MLVEVAALYVVLARSPEKCEAGDHFLCLDSGGALTSVTVVGQGEPQISFSSDLEDALARDLALVEEVRHICVERADNNLLVWIGLDNPVREVRERVFRKELELIEGFPEVDFDFNIVAAVERDPYQFASASKIIYSRRDGNGAN